MNKQIKERPDLSQQALLAIQKKHAASTRILDVVIIALLLLFIYGFSLATLIIPDAQMSEAENRSLQQKPKLSSPMDGTTAEKIAAGRFLDRLVDGSFTAEISDYFADQIPLRDVFVGIKGVCEIGMGKMENNDILLGTDGYLIDRMDYPDMAVLDKNLTAAAEFAKYAEAQGKKVVFAVAGRSMDMLLDKLPPVYDNTYSFRAWSMLYKKIAETGLDGAFVDLRNWLWSPDTDTTASSDADDTQLYYRTDHHWTTEGAYKAYLGIAETLGITPLSRGELTVETATTEFYGTTWSSAGMKWIKPESIEFYRWDGDDAVEVYIADTQTTHIGMYDRDKLTVKDKYSAFLWGNNGEVRVSVPTVPGQTDRPTLLVLKDSYAHSVAPFLAYHYDLIVIDPRYYKKPAADLLAECDAVLMLYNYDSLTNAASLNILRAGLRNH